MASSVDFNTIGFFNSILPLNQTNWAAYFSPSIPDGIMAGIDNEMQVFANSSGMYVYVKTGECRVRSHRGVLSAQATLDIAPADLTYDRKDLVVARVTYGNPSTMIVAVKTGNPAPTPTVLTPTQNAGDVWEIPLAEVFVGHGVVTITAGNVTDRRFVYRNGGMAPETFSGTSVTVENQRSYRNSSSINSLAINLPANPSDIWECSVDFVASSSFSGITFPSRTVYYDGDLKLQNCRYHLDIVWNGSAYFAICSTTGKPVKSFSGTSLTVEDHREHRNATAIASLAITLPSSPSADFISVVCFTSGSSFSGVTFGGKTVKTQGASLSATSVRYNLVIYWDGSYWWCNAEAA